ncbi:MAG: hypothetical protein GC166_00435 [Alphaproteobacteria bacterium]|nr:hypothetical protein [Alphaproteobacteria bacterium]
MIRFLIGSPLLVIVLFVSGFYYAYGQVDPCRALAVERARRAAHASGLPIEDGFERWSRLETSQMSSGQCIAGLLDSWGERLSDKTGNR